MSESKAQVQTWLTDDAGEAWKRGAAMRAQYMAAATQAMLDLAGVSPGHRVLDLAAGTGDQSLDAARRVGPSGYVLATDNSASMLKAAAESALEAGLANVDTRVLDAQAIDLEADTFDAAVCRNGLMFLPDLQLALTGILRVLKPGARFAAVVWSTPEKNPYMSISLNVARRLLGDLGPAPAVQVALSMGRPGLLDEELRRAAFRDVRVQAVPVMRQFESAAEAVRSMRSRSTPTSEGISRLPAAEQEAAWQQVEQELKTFQGPNGCLIPGESLVGVGTK